VNCKFIIFRVTSVRPYFRNEHTEIPEDASDEDSADDAADDAADEDYQPEPEPTAPTIRRRGRPRGSKNKPKNPPGAVHMFFIIPEKYADATENEETWEAFITQKEREDAKLAVELRREGKITAPGKPYEASRGAEIDELIGCGVFRFKLYDPAKYNGIKIFKFRIMDEIKNKKTNKSYEKSQLMIQGYDNNGKFIMLI
jgi:hypothetical protein